MSRPPEALRSRGFTLVELTIVTAIFMILASMGAVVYRRSLILARETVAITEVRQIQDRIDVHQLRFGELPADLSEVYPHVPTDPWGNPYHYYRFDLTKKAVGKKRKDKFIVPINSTYDLYSAGSDGQTIAPLTAPQSWDDVIRANDGDFIGLATDY